MTDAAGPRRTRGARWGNWAAFGVGCALVVLGAVAAEVVVRVAAPGRPTLDEQRSPQYIEPDEVLGWRPLPSLRTRTAKSLAGQIVYDVTYTFDEHRRRVVPRDPPASPRRFLLFFGCSHTFGEGLQDDETLPYYVSQGLPDTRVYNYAFRGYGPQHMLARLETSDLRREIAEAEGAAVYVLPAWAVDRVIGGSATMSWVEELPYYRLENGEPIRDGFFQTTRPLYSRFTRALGSSRMMQWAGVAWPPRVRPADLELTCAVLAKAQRLLNAQLGPTPLVVALHPNGGFHDFASCLAPLGIPILDYHTLFYDRPTTETRIPIDGHTNAHGNRLLAARLAKDVAALMP